MALGTVLSAQVAATKPVAGHGFAGNLKIAYGTYNMAAAPAQNDVIQMCRTPANAIIVGGWVQDGASVDDVLTLSRSTQPLVSSTSDLRLRRIAFTNRPTSVIVRFSRTFIGAIVPRSWRSAGTKATPVAIALRGW